MTRRGWQIPGQPSLGDVAPASPPQERPRTETPPVASEPKSTLRGGVLGQVTDVSEATLQSNQGAEPIMTLRLERNDPHAGRTFLASVRLKGGDSVGFADVGDWIEAVGKRKSAYLVATRCVNHTTGAVYRRSVGQRLATVAKVIAFVVLAIFVVLFLAFAAIQVVDSLAARGGQSARFVQQCLDSGAPPDFCRGPW
jgi:hypothetical protein